MQTDMHYHGTYAMARCAGVNASAARAIAKAAEYVDDSEYIVKQLADGKVFVSEPTAHHPKDAHNLETLDQQRTWVPFHFIPGNAGNGNEKLVCQTDSDIVREIVDRNLTLAKERFGLPLIGITAHVYADTFAHYGFSGVSSPLNHVAVGSVEFDATSDEQESLRSEEQSFQEKYVVPFADAVSALGHAGGSTFPDRPYLTWRFRYTNAAEPVKWRNNQTTFLAACRKLHEMFIRFNEVTENFYLDRQSGVDFDSIAEKVGSILSLRGDWVARAQAWSTAVASGLLFPNSSAEPIPDYDGAKYLSDIERFGAMTFDQVKGTLVFQFLEAARNHREYVLTEVLSHREIGFGSSFPDWLRDKIAKGYEWVSGKECVTA